MPYLGSDHFSRVGIPLSLQQFRLGIEKVIASVAASFNVKASTITESQRGQREENIPRWVVMYLGQALCGLKLKQIADRLGLKQTGSISNVVAKLKDRMDVDESLRGMVNGIKREYDT